MGEEERRSFAGSLLVAHPSMLDPNFRRAVLFISAHDPDDGALGVIIERNQLMFATFEWRQGEGLTLNHYVNIDDASARTGDDAMSICAFVGYAGWSAGQLEAEMKQKAWLLQKPSRAALEPERLPKLWFEIMRGLGPWYKMLAAAPDDPSLN